MSVVNTVKQLGPKEQIIYEQFEQGKMSRREFLDRATEGLFREKRRKVAERHEKYFGKKIL